MNAADCPRCGHDHGSTPCPEWGRLTLGTHGTLAWLAVTVAALGALAQACRYVELGEADA